MRILLVTNWLPPIETGSSFYASNLGRILAKRGHEVLAVTMDWGAWYDPEARHDFPVVRLPVIRTPALTLFYRMELMGFANTSGNRTRMREIVRRFKPDIIHQVNHIFDSVFLSREAARCAAVPLVTSITTPIQHENPYLQWLMRLGDAILLGRRAVPYWDAIVSLDGSVHRYVREAYGDQAASKSVIVPFGARIESMERYDAPLERSSRPQILMVGHVHPFRNPVNLIRAMPAVLREVPDARLVLVGRMDIEEPRRVANKLGLTDSQFVAQGAASHDEVVELYKRSHLFAYWITGPYRSLSTASIEAMLCRTPVVTDLPEDLFGPGVLRSEENLMLVDSSDPACIADTLLRLLRDPALRERIGEAGRRCVLDHLSWPSVGEQIEALYEKLRRSRISPNQPMRR